MKKIEMAKIIVNSPTWDGTKNPQELADTTDVKELKEIFEMMQDAENGMDYMC